MIAFRSLRHRQTAFLRVRAGGMSRDCKPDAALSALVRLVVAGLAFAAWQDAGERHGCHRVKALTRLLRSRRGPASGRLTTVGRRLPAIFGPGREGTRSQCGGQGALSSIWRASFEDCGYRRQERLGREIRAAGARQSSLVSEYATKVPNEAVPQMH